MRHTREGLKQKGQAARPAPLIFEVFKIFQIVPTAA
jgi:hypothetical protein